MHYSDNKTLQQAFNAGVAFALGRNQVLMAYDDAKWITVHPNGAEHKGRPALIDNATGEVLGGMGGKFTGRHISAVKQGGKFEQMGAQMNVNRVNHKPDMMNNQKISSKNIGKNYGSNNQPAENTLNAMTEQEYLNSKGVGGAFSDYMLDKVRTNPNRTEKAKKRFHKEADQARNDYFDKREQARKEYQEKISNGELRNKTTLEQRLEKAQGHEDNASVQAARRLLEKQGIDWRTGKALNAKERIPRLQKIIKIGNETISKLEQ